MHVLENDHHFQISYHISSGLRFITLYYKIIKKEFFFENADI